MGGGNEAALAALPQAPPAVREVLGLLETGQLERATELCRLFPGLRPPLERELRAAEELAASSHQDWSLPPRATRHLAGWAAQGVLARFRAFMLRPVDDQGDAAQTQLSERCSEKERKQALRELQLLGPVAHGFFSWRSWEAQGAKKRTFYLTCTKRPRLDVAAVDAAEAKAAKLRQVLEAAEEKAAAGEAAAAEEPAAAEEAVLAAASAEVVPTATAAAVEGSAQPAPHPRALPAPPDPAAAAGLQQQRPNQQQPAPRATEQLAGKRLLGARALAGQDAENVAPGEDKRIATHKPGAKRSLAAAARGARLPR